MLETENPHFIAGTETWLNPSVYSSEFFPSDYLVFRNDRSDGYGGTVFACHKSFPCTRLPVTTTCEVLVCKISLTNNRVLIIMTIYRPPNTDNNYMQSLCKTIEEIYCTYTNAVIWITGDVNLPNVDWVNNTVTRPTYSLEIYNLLLDTLCSGAFVQQVNSPTRGNNLLDIFATNRPSLSQHVEIIPGISDHEIIKVISKLSIPITKPKERKIFIWGKANFIQLNEIMLHFSDSFLEHYTIDTPIQELWNVFKSKCHECLNLVPSITLSKRTINPWSNRYITRLTNKKKRLYNKARASQLQSDWSAYREIKQQVQRECRKAHDKYVLDIINSDNTRSNKKFWSYIKSKKSEQYGIPTLEKDHQLITDNLSKANILNDQFSSVYTIDTACRDNIPTLKVPSFPTMQPLDVDVQGIYTLLSDLDSYKASGPDGIPPRLLKELSVNIAPILALIFKASLHQGKLPSDWKMATVVPVYKKGSRTDPTNYRPISLTCICCKVFEHIISSAISQHANINNIIGKEQHGFRKNRSCETQLLETINDLAIALNNGKQIDLLLLDFSKAFDKVSHQRLLHKLLHYGINGPLFNWIKDYLSNRLQKVILDGAVSSCSDVKSGVPQGSVLGPLLFLLYINDLPCEISSTIRLYADDVIIYRQIDTKDDVLKLQEDLAKLSQWAQDWLMIFNLSKCEHLCVTNKHSPVISDYFLNASPITKVSSCKYLGITITSNLSWNKHISNIASRAHSVRGFLQRNLKQCSKAVKSKAYLAFVRPVVEYASIIWSPHTNSNISILEMVQRKAARFVFGDYSTYSSVSNMLQELQWISLQERRRQARLIMFYKILHNVVEVDFDVHLNFMEIPTRGHQLKFRQLSTRLDSFKHSFLPATIRDWNSLPIEVVTSPNLDQFTAKLNNFYMHTHTHI